MEITRLKFDEHNINWRPDLQYNLIFLRSVQQYYNDLLEIQGHVFLNEILDALGFDRSKAGALCGWVYNKDAKIVFEVMSHDLNNLNLRIVNQGLIYHTLP